MAFPCPTGFVASTPAEAADAATRLGGSVWVVKAQVHAGGRGKAGGVKVVKNLDDVASAAAGMLGKRLIDQADGAGRAADPPGLRRDRLARSSASCTSACC